MLLILVYLRLIHKTVTEKELFEQNKLKEWRYRIMDFPEDGLLKEIKGMSR